MLRLMVIVGLAAALTGCVAYPAGYGYADPGYAYGPDYAPAYGYGSINVWSGGGYHHGDYHRWGWGHGYGHGHWEGRHGGGHGGGHGGHGR